MKAIHIERQLMPWEEVAQRFEQKTGRPIDMRYCRVIHSAAIRKIRRALTSFAKDGAHAQ